MQKRRRLTIRCLVFGLLVGLGGGLVACGDPSAPASPSSGPLAPASSDLAGRLTLRPEGIVLEAGEAGEAGLRALGESLRAGDAHPSGDARITVDYPHDGTLFPPDLVAPTFLWHDADATADAWLIDIEFSDGEQPLLVFVPGVPEPLGEIDPETLGPTNEVYQPTPHQASAHSWTPAPETWDEMKGRSRERTATVTIHGIATTDAARARNRGHVSFSTSEDPVGAPIFYRDVPLMPAVSDRSGVIQPLSKNGIPLIAWRLRDLSQPESKVVLTGMPSCANCHSFSQDGRTLAMDVDGPQGDKGSYGIAPIQKRTVIDTEHVITWNSFPEKKEGHKTIGFLSRVSPDGRYVLSTVNEELYVSNFTDFKILQVFYPTRGILACYDTVTRTMRALPGADDPAFVHCNPVWSPDGKEIVFCRAEAFDPVIPGRPLATRPNDPNEPRIRYDLYRMPFNDGEGGTAVPVVGASENGMSNTFPKISPDGKWIVYTKCRNGLLLRPDGKLWIVPLAGGEAREMRCNTSLMNSWHSFSPNGKWMVFTSKVNTPYTQMFLTHIDEEGNDTPYVLVPNSTAANRAVNLPEFVNNDYEALDTIQVPAVNHHEFYQQGRELTDAGNYAEAVPVLEAALRADPTFVRAHIEMGDALGRLGRYDRAIVHLVRARDLDPRNPDVYNALGAVFGYQERTAEAAEQFQRALDFDAMYFPALMNLGILLRDAGRPAEGVSFLERALEVRPGSPDVYSQLAQSALASGDTKAALRHLGRAVDLKPGDYHTSSLLAFFLATNPDPALRNGKQALALAVRACEQSGRADPQCLDALAAAYAETGAFDQAVRTIAEAQRLVGSSNSPLAERMAVRARYYRSRKPYRFDPAEGAGR